MNYLFLLIINIHSTERKSLTGLWNIIAKNYKKHETVRK
jgi:hypothetical protein